MGRWRRGSGECKPRIEVIVKLQNKCWGWWWSGGGGLEESGSCEPRIEVAKEKSGREGVGVVVEAGGWE